MADKKVALDPIEARIDAMMKDKLRSLGIEIEEDVEERNDLEFTASQIVINRDLLQAEPSASDNTHEQIERELKNRFHDEAVQLEKEINTILLKFRSNNPKVENELNKIKNLLSSNRKKFE